MLESGRQLMYVELGSKQWELATIPNNRINTSSVEDAVQLWDAGIEALGREIDRSSYSASLGVQNVRNHASIASQRNRTDVRGGDR